MNLAKLYYRCRWLHGPAGLLVVLLQRTPALRVFSQAECLIEDGGGAVLKSVFGLVALGAYNSVAGATTFGVNPATPTTGLVNQRFAISGTVGTAMSEVFTVTGAPGNPRSWSVTGTLPPGLSVTGGNPVNVTAPYKMTIAGTPTTSGSWTVTVTAWSSSNGAGDHANISCAFSIAGGVASTAPLFTTQPQSVTVNAGGSTTFTAAASGSPSPTYQWYHAAASLSGQTAASLSLTNIQTTDAGNYTVVATNAAGSATSSAATLTVQSAPSITTQPQSATVNAGGSVSFSVSAGGSPAPTYQWLNGGANIAGATGSTYTINSAQPSDAGSYTVVVSNAAGSLASNAATLTVFTSPAITAQPQNISVTTGSSATFSVVAGGSAPLGYQWQKGGAVISGATSATYTIGSAQMGDAGSYTVVVSNSLGSVTSTAATLTVTAVAVAPSITAQPQSASVTAGSGVSFIVTAAGTSPLSYQWRKGGVAIAGATSSSYTIPSPQLTDAGSYTVIVNNSAGSVTSSPATLTVNPVPAAPAITTQPTSETVATGHNVSFSIAASSSQAASYQWSVSTDGGATWAPLQDNANYAGTTTSTLTVTNTTAAMNGYLYRCTASNSAGSVNSNALTLSVAVAIFPSPVGLAINGAGTIYVSDSSNNTIQAVNTSWQAAALAGAAGQQGASDGTGTAALFRQPGGVALDGAGNLYVADTGNSIIRKISSTGVVTTLAGSASNQGYRDGMGTAAWFNSPAAVALDSAGNLYVADAGNAVIRKIAPDGTVSTVAGSAGATGAADGAGASARFNQPSGIAVDGAGNLYVADTFNQTIRKITPAGLVTTLAGLAGISGSIDGSGAGALFNQPRGLTVDTASNLYVADTANSAIRKITPAGVVTTVAGLSTVAGFMDGTGINAWLNQPRDVKVDSAGNLYVADTGNAAIRKITPAAVVTTPTITAVAAASSSPSPSPATGSGSAASDAAPGKSGGGSVEGWFVLGLIALASARRAVAGRKFF